jgi:hypothetical protein
MSRQVLIDVTRVPEMTATSSSATGVTVGAAVSLAQLIEICRAQDPMSPRITNDASTESVMTATSSFAALARHLLLVASYQVRAPRSVHVSDPAMVTVDARAQVRSVGSWAGNVMLAAHYHDFPSDVALVRSRLQAVRVLKSRLISRLISGADLDGAGLPAERHSERQRDVQRAAGAGVR